MTFETLGFACSYFVQVDPQFPGDGEWGCRVVGFDRTGTIMREFDSRWGTPLVAHIQPDSGPNWVAMFAAGGLGSLRGAFATPSPNLLAVVVDGLAYLVESRLPERPAQILRAQVHQVVPCPDPPLLLFAGVFEVVAVGTDGIAWATPRLCVEGLQVRNAGRAGIACSCDHPDGTATITLDPMTGTQIEGIRWPPDAAS